MTEQSGDFGEPVAGASVVAARIGLIAGPVLALLVFLLLPHEVAGHGGNSLILPSVSGHPQAGQQLKREQLEKLPENGRSRESESDVREYDHLDD